MDNSGITLNTYVQCEISSDYTRREIKRSILLFAKFTKSGTKRQIDFGAKYKIDSFR